MNAGGAPSLFFGIFPDPAARQTLAGLAQAIACETHGRAPRPERIHLTLFYLGPTPPGRMEEVQAVGASIRAQAFDVKLVSIGRWPNNIIYAAPAGNAALTALGRSFALKLIPEGFKDKQKQKQKQKRFAPHVTLVRDAITSSRASMPPVAWRVDRFALVHSILVPGKPRYEILAEFPLEN